MQVFGAIWSLVEIGALSTAGQKRRHAWRDYARAHDETLRTLVEQLSSTVGYERDVARMLVADAPWREELGEGDLPAGDLLAAEMTMMVGASREDYPAVRATPIDQLCRRATVHQLAQLLDGVVVAVYQRWDGAVALSVVHVEAVMSLAMRLAIGDQPAKPVGWETEVFEHWRRAFVPRLGDAPGGKGFSQWLRAAVNTLATSWARKQLPQA